MKRGAGGGKEPPSPLPGVEGANENDAPGAVRQTGSARRQSATGRAERRDSFPRSRSAGAMGKKGPAAGAAGCPWRTIGPPPSR